MVCLFGRISCLLICVQFSMAVVCPAGWTENLHHGTCLRRYSSSQNWTEARHTCSQMGSTLAHLDSQEMFDLLRSLISGKETWVATNDLVEEGVYRGVGGQPLTFLPWTKNQPNDGTPRSQNGVIVKNGGIMDRPTRGAYRYVCEMWPRDFNATIFTTLPEEVVQTSKFALDTNTYFRLLPATRLQCAMECRRQRPTCDAFVFTRHGSCSSLRVYDIQDDVDALSFEGQEVYMMQGW